MKNHSLRRLAGFGFFGISFLSPGSTEKNDWPIDEFNSARILVDLPFTESAFCQESNYPQKLRNTPGTANIIAADPLQQSAIFPEEPVSSPKEDTLSRPARPNIATIRNNTSKKKDGFSSEEQFDSSGILIYTPPVTDDIAANPETTGEVRAGEYNDEFLLPPTEYVDEIKKPVTSRQLQGNIPIITTAAESGLDYYPESLLEDRIDRMYDFAERLGYSTKYALLINLGLKSGKKRFLIIDLEKRSIVNSGLVAHGRGKEKFTLSKKYSNNSGSACSSLGLYKVGGSYNGGFGKSFRLIGLEKTNNNALNRAIVLHSMSCIPDEEIDYPICQSEGCPSVSPGFLLEISKVIKHSTKPILLWAFDPTVDKDFSP